MDGNFFAGSDTLTSYAPPVGYSAGHDGIYIETENKEGEVEREWLCSPPTDAMLAARANGGVSIRAPVKGATFGRVAG